MIFTLEMGSIEKSLGNDCLVCVFMYERLGWQVAFDVAVAVLQIGLKIVSGWTLA